MLRQNGRDNVPLSFLREVRPFAEQIDAVLILNNLFRAREVLLGDTYNTTQQNLPVIKDICARTDVQSYLKAYRISININAKNAQYTSAKHCEHINSTRYSKQTRAYIENESPDFDARDLGLEGGNTPTNCSGMNSGEPLDSLVRRLDTLLRCLYGNRKETTDLRAARPLLSASNIQMIFQPCLSKKSNKNQYEDDFNTRLRDLSRQLNNPQYVVTNENILSLLRPLQQQCRQALNLDNTLTITTPPWSPPQVTTTNSMLTDISRGIDAIRKNRENCQTQGECRSTTRTLTDYKKLVNHIMNKYSREHHVHNKDINAHIDQLRFFDVVDGNKRINVEKVIAFWSDAMIRAYGKSLQLRSTNLTRTNFRDIYNHYVQFSQCRDDELRARFSTLVAFGFERPVKARYAGCEGTNSNIAYAANVINYIIEKGADQRDPTLTPQRIKRRYTLMVRRRTPQTTRRLNEQFIYTTPHEEREGEELTGVTWEYKKAADDSLLKTVDDLERDSATIPQARPDMTARARQAIAAPNPETTKEAFAALW